MALLRKITRSPVIFILALQVVLSLLALLYVQFFEFDKTYFDFIQIQLRHEIEYTSFNLLLFGFDVGYLLTAPPSELKEFFPRFYWLISLMGWCLRYVLPISLGVYYFRSSERRNRFAELLRNKFHNTPLIALFLSSLFVSLTFYFSVIHFQIQSVEFQIFLARIFLGLNVLVVLIVAVLHRSRLMNFIDEFLFRPTLPYTLAITRILFFSYSIFLYLIIFRIGHGSNLGVLEKVPLPGIGWLIEIIPVNSQIYSWFCFVGAFVSLMIVLGYKTRFFLFLNAIIVFYVVATPNFFGKLWHEQLVIWISWILAFSPCADVLSIDAKRKEPKPVEANPIYGFHLKVIWLHFGLIYFFAGFYKLWDSGFDWALSDSMIHLVQIEWFEHFDKVSSWRVDKIPILLKIGGMGVILFELTYALMLFGKRLKWMSIFGGLVMHNFLGKVMYISFFSLLQVFYLVFIPWNWILTKTGLASRNCETTWDRPRIISPVILFPLIMFGLNAWCGVFAINSYPFSIYPVYTDILPENVKYFEYKVLDKGKRQLDFREEGAKANFRWEDFSREEYHIIRMAKSDDGLDTAAVEKLWNRWQLGVPVLNAIDSLDVYIVERPLDPERKNERLSEKYLMSIGYEK